MGIFSRFTDIVNSNINTILDKAEDPEKLVRLMIQEMEDTLVEVRSAAARAIANKKELTRKLSALDREIDEWHNKAELAIAKGRDDLAKAALAEKSRITATREALAEQYKHIEDSLNQLNDDISRLEAKLADAKARKKALVMRHQTASRRLDVRKQIYDNKIDDALVRFEQFERKMEHMEGRVESYDMGLKKDLGKEIDSLAADETVEKELTELKKRLSKGSSNTANS